MNIRLAIFVIGAIGFAVRAYSAAPIDPRLVLISQAELQKDINHISLNSPKQFELISRSRSSHLADFAYKQFDHRTHIALLHLTCLICSLTGTEKPSLRQWVSQVRPK